MRLWEGEESSCRYKQESGRKRKKKKVHPEAFQKYKAPLISLPNWCLRSVKAI